MTISTVDAFQADAHSRTLAPTLALALAQATNLATNPILAPVLPPILTPSRALTPSQGAERDVVIVSCCRTVEWRVG